MTVNNSINAPNALIQEVYSSTTSTINIAVGSNIPGDNTKPQNTEGTEVLTATITPTSATNRLVISFVGDVLAGTHTSHSETAAMFQDTTADSIAAVQCNRFAANDSAGFTASFRHEMTAGTTSATTFKVRIGSDPGKAVAMVLNANGYGGVNESSITIKEYQV